MCGIVGYFGKRKAADILVDGLRRLEYRGYDSAGVACLYEGQIDVVKIFHQTVAQREQIRIVMSFAYQLHPDGHLVRPSCDR